LLDSLLQENASGLTVRADWRAIHFMEGIKET